MKRVLLISDHDSTGLRLLELYSAMFANERKELFFCTINIMDCGQMDGIYHRSSTTSHRSERKLSNLPKVYNTPRPHKSLHATSCAEIFDIVRENNINLVLVPNFIYDMQRTAQYLEIVKDLRRRSSIDIVGLYI